MDAAVGQSLRDVHHPRVSVTRAGAMTKHEQRRARRGHWIETHRIILPDPGRGQRHVRQSSRKAVTTSIA